MLDPMSDEHYEAKFELPLWTLIKERADAKDISYYEAAAEVVPEYMERIRYDDLAFEDAVMDKSEAEAVAEIAMWNELMAQSKGTGQAMSLQRLADKVIESDVLVLGGGVAGCPVAFKAAEKGLSVTLIEKAKTDRSGHAGAGIDTLLNFPREGISLVEHVRSWQKRQENLNGAGRFADPNISYVTYAAAYWAMDEMEKMGLSMKWQGDKYHWNRNKFYAMAEAQMGVHWMDVKPKMGDRCEAGRRERP